jgi:hypothetical protein
MEELIRQAFLHVEIIGPHVVEGHYDLVGQSGEIILPQVWESMIEPDWAVTMHMWPLPAPPKVAPDGVHVVDIAPGRPSGSGLRYRERGNLPPPLGGRRGPPPPPPGWIGPPPGRRTGCDAESEEIIIIEDMPDAPKSSKKKASDRHKYRRTYDSSDSDSSDSDSDKLVSDSEIDDDGLDEELVIGIDFEKEEEKAEVPLGELLGMWTNATDTGHMIIPEVVNDTLSDSDSDSESGSDSLADY